MNEWIYLTKSSSLSSTFKSVLFFFGGGVWLRHQIHWVKLVINFLYHMMLLVISCCATHSHMLWLCFPRPADGMWANCQTWKVHWLGRISLHVHNTSENSWMILTVVETDSMINIITWSLAQESLHFCMKLQNTMKWLFAIRSFVSSIIGYFSFSHV